MELGEVRLQALFDVLNGLKPILLFQVYILLNRLLLLIHKLCNLLPNLFPVMLSRLKPCPNISLPLLNGLLLDPDHLLLLQPVSIEILVDLGQLLIEHHVELFFSLIDDLIKSILESSYPAIILI